MLQLHQRDQPVHLRLGRSQPGEHPPEPQRLDAQSGPHPVPARGGRVPLVEDQVHHLGHRRQPRRQLRPGRHRERHPLPRQGRLRPGDALRHRRFRRQERPRDLGGGQPAQQPQRQRHPRRHRQHRVAGGEHQPQPVVADVVVHTRHDGVDVRPHRRRPGGRVPPHLVQPALPPLPFPQRVHRAPFAHRRQPRPRIVRHPGGGPLLQRRHQRVLRQFLGQADVVRDPGQGGRHTRRLDAPHRLDRTAGVRHGAQHSSP